MTGPGDDLRAAVDAYAAACATRAEEAASAASAEPLRQQLAARRQLEEAAARAAATTEQAHAELVVVAVRVGLETDGRPPETIVADLEAWQSNREQELRTAGQAIAEWQELTDLLAGRSLEAMAAEARDGTRRLAAAGLALPVAGTPGSRMTGGGPGPAGDQGVNVEAARGALLSAERDAAAVGAQADQLAASLPSVAEAEERHAGARLELQRVTGLAAIVDRTIELLETAQEQVHRDLAPILADAVRSWLPRVSDGAYLDVAVDPADLKVQVKEAATGRWRDARRLSAGTREQIYLLLRVAMAQHLVTTDETAPLLLDEVTAQADDRRRDQLLDVLAELSLERQVVLFTHDPRIADWADGQLSAERNRVIRLSAHKVPVA
jgi:DNA repair exonuclease SbcCD ATPase subunit